MKNKSKNTPAAPAPAAPAPTAPAPTEPAPTAPAPVKPSTEHSLAPGVLPIATAELLQKAADEAKAKKDAAKTAGETITKMTREIMGDYVRIANKYFALASFIRKQMFDNVLTKKEATGYLLAAGIIKQRATEVITVASSSEQVWSKFLAMELGFRGVLKLERGNDKVIDIVAEVDNVDRRMVAGALIIEAESAANSINTFDKAADSTKAENATPTTTGSTTKPSTQTSPAPTAPLSAPAAPATTQSPEEFAMHRASVLAKGLLEVLASSAIHFPNSGLDFNIGNGLVLVCRKYQPGNGRWCFMAEPTMVPIAEQKPV